jgi:hypothetical protein
MNDPHIHQVTILQSFGQVISTMENFETFPLDRADFPLAVFSANPGIQKAHPAT